MIDEDEKEKERERKKMKIHPKRTKKIKKLRSHRTVTHCTVFVTIIFNKDRDDQDEEAEEYWNCAY